MPRIAVRGLGGFSLCRTRSDGYDTHLNEPPEALPRAASDNMSMTTSYTWNYEIAMPPYDKLVEVTEAFFASYPGGDYRCEVRDRYRLEFRRGLWRRSLMGFGQWVPDRLVKGQFNQWPLLVRVLARPAPDVYSLTIRYELHLPRSVPSLGPNLQASVVLHVEHELSELAIYLARCAELPEPPEVRRA